MSTVFFFFDAGSGAGERTLALRLSPDLSCFDERGAGAGILVSTSPSRSFRKSSSALVLTGYCTGTGQFAAQRSGRGQCLDCTFGFGCVLPAPLVKYSLIFLSLASRLASSSWRVFFAVVNR